MLCVSRPEGVECSAQSRHRVVFVQVARGLRTRWSCLARLADMRGHLRAVKGGLLSDGPASWLRYSELWRYANCRLRTKIRARSPWDNLQTPRPGVPPRWTASRQAPSTTRFSSSICAQRYYRHRPSMPLATRVIAKRCARRGRRSAVSARGGSVERQRGAVSTHVRRRVLRDKGRVAGHGGSCRGVDRRQLALSLPARRKAILLARRGAIASFGGSYVPEGDCAFYVFASEHGCVFPCYKDADIRGGHGMAGTQRGLLGRKQLIWYPGQATWRLPDMYDGVQQRWQLRRDRRMQRGYTLE
jgi:hypothetical protein